MMDVTTPEKPTADMKMDKEKTHSSAEGQEVSYLSREQPESMPPLDTKVPTKKSQDDSGTDIVYLRGLRFAIIALTFVTISI